MKCSICYRQTGRQIDRQNNLHMCLSCSHTFKNIPNEKQERYLEDYFIENHKNWFSYPNYRLFKFIYKEIANHIGNRRLNLLDIGCGKGDFLRYLKETDSNVELYGIDLAQNQCPGIHFISGDIYNTSLKMKFDVVCALGVIEHVDSPHLFVQKIKNFLLPGGLVFIMTIDNESLIFKTARFLKKIGISSAYDRLYDTHHLQFFTKRSLKTLMELNDFETIFAKNHNYPLRAVDLPKTTLLMKKLYLCAVGLIFILSSVFGNGILQTVMYKKGETKSPDCCA